MTGFFRRFLGAAILMASMASWSQADDCCPSKASKYDIHNFYAGASGALAWTKKFNGGGGMAHVGYTFSKADYGDFALEFETGYLNETGDTSAGTAFKNFPIQGGTKMRMTQHRRGEIEMVPLLLNFSYHVKLAKWFKWTQGLLLTLGGGVGFNIMTVEDRCTARYYDGLGHHTGTQKVNRSRTKGEFAGQVYCRFGFGLTENLQVYTGARAFFTAEGQVGTGTISELNSEVAHLIVDLGLNYHW